MICIYPNNVASENHFNDECIVNEDENEDLNHNDDIVDNVDNVLVGSLDQLLRSI